MRNRVTGETYIDPLFEPMNSGKKAGFGHVLSQIALQKGLHFQSSVTTTIDSVNTAQGTMPLGIPLLSGDYRGYSNWAHYPSQSHTVITRVGFVQNRSMLIAAGAESTASSLSELVTHAIDSRARYTSVHEQKISSQGERIGMPIIRMLAIESPNVIMFRLSSDDELCAIAPDTGGWEDATKFRDQLAELTFDKPVLLESDDIARIGLAD